MSSNNVLRDNSGILQSKTVYKHWQNLLFQIVTKLKSTPFKPWFLMGTALTLQQLCQKLKTTVIC